MHPDSSKTTKRTMIRATLTVACAALVCAAPAAAVPRLLVYESDYRPVVSTGVAIALTEEKSDPATAKIVLALQGGTIDVSKTPGTVVGSADAIVATDSASVFGGKMVTFTGSMVAADPAQHVADGTLCTGRTFHDAVWALDLTAGGQSLPLTVYADRWTDSIGSKYEVTMCLPSPYVSSDGGGAPFGVRLSGLVLYLDDVFRNPSTPAEYHWSAFVTPFAVGGSAPDPREAVETRALTPVPYLLSLRGAAPGAGGRVALAGRLSGPRMHFGGDRLRVYAGANPDRMHLVGRTNRVASDGTFTFKGTVSSRTAYFQVTFGPVDLTTAPGGCSGYSPAAGGCVSATLSEIDSNVVRLRVRR
jgi:hypothetical protein